MIENEIVPETVLETEITKSDPYEKFKGPIPVRQLKSPLNYSLTETNKKDFDQSIIPLLKSMTNSCADLTDVNKLRIRIMEHIHVCSLDQTTLSLRYLNQKFGLVAQRLGVNTRKIVDDLIQMDSIIAIDVKSKTGYFSSEVWSDARYISEISEKSRLHMSASDYCDLLISNMIERGC